jgi:uncharacterized RDD family membrane protein YckC
MWFTVAMPAVGPVSRSEPVEVPQEEILTGEAVALDVQPVGFFLRALGTVIDMLVALGAGVLLALAATWLLGEDILLASTQPIVTVAVIVAVTVILPTVVETVSHGRSLGRLAVGARIVRTDGGAAGLRHAFIRALAGVFELWLTVGAVAALVGAFTPRAQRLGDLLAGTYSERTRAPRLPSSSTAEALLADSPTPLRDWERIADVSRLPERLARRCAQFEKQAARLDPGARAAAAASLAAELAAFVSPVPDVDPELFVRSAMAVRRRRELHALELEDAAAERLTSGITGIPSGFPSR